MKSDKFSVFSSAPVTAPLLVTLVLVLLSLSGFFLDKKTDNENIYLLISVVQLSVFIFPCVVYYFIKGRKLSTPLFVSAVKPGQFLFLFFSFLLLVSGTILIKFLYYIIAEASPTEVNFFVASADTSTTGILEVLIAFVIVPSVCEELFFRGLILSEYRTFGAFNAIVFSSICFSMAHFSFDAFPIYFYSGIILGITAIVCRSVFASIIIHMFSNLLSIYISDLFLRITVQKCGAVFVGFILITFFLASLFLVLSRTENIYWNRSEKPPQTMLPPRSAGNVVPVYLSPAFFILIFVFILITILI